MTLNGLPASSSRPKPLDRYCRIFWSSRSANGKRRHRGRIRQVMNLRWDLIFPLAVLGLVRPLLSILGVYGSFERPWGPILVTVSIAAIWLSVVVIGRVPNPLVTLAVVGGVYGILAILLQQTMWNLYLEDPPEGTPSSAPIIVIGWVSIIATKVIWGAILGVVALGARRLLTPSK
jgi:hypothetical protein